MRILYLSQYFPPEVGATQTRAYEMARNLVKIGHEVTILAEIPNHPTGIIPPEYQGKVIERSQLEGIDVIRVWVKTSPTKTSFTRIAFYLTYMINAFLAGVFFAHGPFDIVYASSPPLFVACAGWALSRVRRVSFVMEVRDLWPAVAVSLGELSNPLILRLAEKLELFLYRKASAIIPVTHGFCQYIQKLGISEVKMFWIPNGTSPEVFDPARVKPELRTKLGLNGKFVVAFAGLHGIAQGLPSILETAKHLQEHPQIVFLFIGEGPVKKELVAIKERDNLTNVIFLSEVPREEIPYYLNISNVLLVPLKDDKIFETFIPSKLFDFMACAKPIILSVPGEAREILETSRSGVFVPPEDSQQLKQAILDLSSQDPTQLHILGKRGREHVIEHYSRDRQAQQLSEVLENIGI